MPLTVVLTTEKEAREAKQLCLTGCETIELLATICSYHVFASMK